MEGNMTIARKGKRMPFFETTTNTESFPVVLEVKDGCIYAKSKQHMYTIDLECAKSCNAYVNHNIDSHRTYIECKKMGYTIDGRVVCSGLRITVSGEYEGDGDELKKILESHSFYIAYSDDMPDYSRDV